MSDSLSAIEFMDWESVQLSLDYLQMENPFRDKVYKYYLLVEMSGNQEEAAMQEKMLKLFESLDGYYEDGIICDSET